MLLFKFQLFIGMHFFKEKLGLKLTHERITTKVVLPVSRVRVLYRGIEFFLFNLFKGGGGGYGYNTKPYWVFLDVASVNDGKISYESDK